MSIKIAPKIAYVMTPITFGGAERVNLNFLKNVDRDKLNIEPIIFLRPWEDDNAFEAELKRIGFHYYVIPVARSAKSDFLQIIRRFQILKKIIDSNSFDLIHSHGYMADILCYMVAKILKIPIVSTCHGFIYEGRKLSFYNYIDCFVLKQFTKIITVSDLLKEDLIKTGINKHKINVIENTPHPHQDLDDNEEVRNKLRKKINVTPNDFLVGYVGRLSKEKGVLFLLESMKTIKCDTRPIKLLIIGEGIQLKELGDMVKSNNLSSKVIFTGFQSNIDEWFTAIDLFVLPSLTEGTPMVLLEAMSHGIPCIASAVGGVPKIIETGVDGVLISPANPDEITSAVISLACDPEKRSFMSKNAINKVLNKYNINEWTKKIENEYLCIFNSKPAEYN